MNLCSDGHEEICYEANTCPLCYFIKEKDESERDLERTIIDLTDERDSLSRELDELKIRITELETREIT